MLCFAFFRGDPVGLLSLEESGALDRPKALQEFVKQSRSNRTRNVQHDLRYFGYLQSTNGQYCA